MNLTGLNAVDPLYKKSSGYEGRQSSLVISLAQNTDAKSPLGRGPIVF